MMRRLPTLGLATMSVRGKGGARGACQRSRVTSMGLGYEAFAGTPEETVAWVKADYERDGKLATLLALRLD